MSTLETFSTQTEQPQRPAGDSPVMPRSQVKMLTDSGVVTDEQVATPLFNEEAEQQADDQDQLLQGLLDEHDATNESSSDTSQPQADEQTSPDYESPKFKALADEFKQQVGIDLKEAIESYQRMTEMVQQQSERQAQQEYQQAATSLKSDWGVNDAEFNRRVSAVLEYANTLPADLRQQFDNVKGIKLLWSQVERRSAAPQSASSRGDAQRSTNPSGAKTFRKSELMNMMTNNPVQYNAMQAEINRAFEAGTVIDDL